MTLNQFTATPASDAVVPVRRDIPVNRDLTPAVVT
jgi:hypothetical protein